MESIQLIYENYAFQVWALLFLLLVVLAVWLIILHRQMGQLRERYGALLVGGEGEDLGELLSMYVEQMRLAGSKANQLARASEQIERKLESSIQRVGLVRFDAFEDTAGEQSFVVALLDAQGNGVVVSSLQGRAEGRLYAKPVRRWDSSYNLSVEEKEAIARAYRSEVDKSSQL